MKVDLIRKYKWYLAGVIAVVLIMSIGLSFCTWDSNSVKSSLSAASGNYDISYDYAYIDNNKNRIMDNGDIITNFGNFNLRVANTTTDGYYVVTTCNAGDSVFSSKGNNDYMTSDIRTLLNTTYLNNYGELEKFIKPNNLLDGDKLFLMSIEEATSNYFVDINNRLGDACSHSANRWTWLRDKSQHSNYSDNVAMLEGDGRISISPENDIPNHVSPFRYAMWLCK